MNVELAPKSSNLKMDNFLYLLHEDGDIDDEELLLLLEDHPRNLHAGLPYLKYEPFYFFEMREEECEVEFRFKKEDIFRLAAALRLPEIWKCQKGVVVDTVEGLCIALKRFAYPCRFVDLIPRFARPVSQLCMITNLVVDHLYTTFGYLLTDLDQPWLSRKNLKVFADTIHDKGAALLMVLSGQLANQLRIKEQFTMVIREFMQSSFSLLLLQMDSLQTSLVPWRGEGMTVACLQCQGFCISKSNILSHLMASLYASMEILHIL